MPSYVYESGTPTRVTATGVTVLTSGPAVMLGVYVASVLTGQIVQLWTQTAGSVTGRAIIGTATMASGTFHTVPAQCPLGITYAVTNDDVDLTIYWNPMGGAT